jgi:hypothetical protein
VEEKLGNIQRNTDVCSLNIICKYDLHMPTADLTNQGAVNYTGLKLFINFLLTIKSLYHDKKVFKPALKDYLFYFY